MKNVLLLFLLYMTSNAWTYPIFYKCGPNGELSENFSVEEITKLAESKKMDTGACGDNYDCLKQFRQILLLATGSMEAASSYFLKEQVKKMSDSDFSAMSESARTANKLKQCHDMQRENPSGDKHYVDIYYPNETLYQYVTGYRKDNRNDYDGFRRPYRPHLDALLEDAVRTGVDPLAVLGMVMMERGGGYIDRWHENMHDKRSQMVLGCRTGGPLGQIAPRSKEINQIAEDLGYAKASKNYLCVGRKKDGQYIDDTRGFAKYSSLEYAKRSGASCCVEFHHQVVSSYTAKHDGRKLTTLLYYKQLQDLDHYNPLAGRENQKSVTHRLNTFLGMSKTVGTFPSYRVSPARVGVNSYKDPNYGRQIMDWQLNSFLRNGYIMDKIQEYSKKHGKPYISLLCSGKEPGNYAIDSDHYLNKIKSSERMLPIKAMYDDGKSWNQLGIRFQSVLLQEFTANGSEVKERLAKYLSKDEMAKLEKHASHLYEYRNASLRRGKENPGPLPPEGNAIFDKVYRLYFSKKDLYESRKTFAQASAQDSGLSWDRSSDEDILKISEEVR